MTVATMQMTRRPEVRHDVEDVLLTMQRHGAFLHHLLDGAAEPGDWLLEELRVVIAQRTAQAFREVRHTMDQVASGPYEQEDQAADFLTLMATMNALAAVAGTSSGGWTNPTTMCVDPAEWWEALYRTHHQLASFVRIYDHATDDLAA